MLFGLIVVLVFIGAGGFAYARYDMEARLRGYSGAIDGIGFSRGGNIPSEAEFTESARAAADSMNLEIVSLTVTRTEESGRDAVGDLMEDRLGGLGSIRMELVRYDVEATLVAKKWLFSRTAEVSADRTYRREVRLETPSARVPPAVRSEPTQPRGI
jgi:hypothetical protein